VAAKPTKESSAARYALLALLSGRTRAPPNRHHSSAQAIVIGGIRHTWFRIRIHPLGLSRQILARFIGMKENNMSPDS
jgi:hypothetical protein